MIDGGKNGGHEDAVVITVIPCVNRGEELLVLLDQIGQLRHENALVGARHQPPRVKLQCGVGGLHCPVNIFCARCVNSDNLVLGPSKCCGQRWRYMCDS